MPLSSTERHLRAKIAAHTRWAREPDRAAATAAARQAYADRFIEAARLLHPTLSEPELKVRAANLRSAEAARMAKARWGRKEKLEAADVAPAASDGEGTPDANLAA